MTYIILNYDILGGKGRIETMRLIEINTDSDSNTEDISEHEVFMYGSQLQNGKIDDETRHIILKRVKDREMR